MADQSLQDLIAGWIRQTMQETVDTARRYLDDHPDELGVIVHPTVRFDDKVVEFEPEVFVRREDWP